MASFTYDPNDVNLKVDGETISGFADGTFITGAKEEDEFTKTKGAHGDIVYNVNRKDDGTVTVTLLGSSSSNAVFSKLAADGAVFDMECSHANRDDKMTGIGCRMKKTADLSEATEDQSREWVIDCSILKLEHGGASED